MMTSVWRKAAALTQSWVPSRMSLSYYMQVLKVCWTELQRLHGTDFLCTFTATLEVLWLAKHM